MKATATTLTVTARDNDGLRDHAHAGRSTSSSIAPRCMRIPEIDPVRGKILIPITYGAGQPIEILANRTMPTAAGAGGARRGVAGFRGLQRATPWKSSDRCPRTGRVSNDRVADALARLYAGELTFGEFGRDMLYIGERDQLASEELNQALRAQERWDLSNNYGN